LDLGNIRSLDLVFLNKLQELHDDNRHWNRVGLSGLGKTVRKDIIKYIYPKGVPANVR